MSDAMLRPPADERERLLRPAVGVGPYVLLAVLAVLTTATRYHTGVSLRIDLALCALAAGWMLWMVTLHPAWRERQGLMAVFVTVLILILAVLVVRDPWFGLLSPIGYVYAFRLLPWPGELFGVAAVAVVAGSAQSSGVPLNTFGGLAERLAVIAVNILPMCGLSWLLQRGAQHDQQRERILGALREANRRLEATLAENAGLHEQLVTQAREAGVQDERQRMAREIHDTLAQGLTGIITQLHAAEHAREDPAGWERHLTAATALARESLSEARRSVHALRPEPLRMAHLGEAIAEVAGAGRPDTTSPSTSRRPAPRVRYHRRPRTRCCAPRRRHWPTWPNTHRPPGSASPCRTWKPNSPSTYATTVKASTRPTRATVSVCWPCVNG
jgi:signal transduction histidine kinase